jgi:hypothetical protein
LQSKEYLFDFWYKYLAIETVASLILSLIRIERGEGLRLGNKRVNLGNSKSA